LRVAGEVDFSLFAGVILSPPELFELFERGEIEREELQALMAVHARELIREMEEDHQNRAAAWLEGVRSRRAAARLVSRHGGRLVREILVALSAVRDFPPAGRLWNAGHADVPLHCFLRIRRRPVFRIAAIQRLGDSPDCFEVLVEHGEPGRGKAESRRFVLKRDESWRLRVAVEA
jgi:hypothetical protein